MREMRSGSVVGGSMGLITKPPKVLDKVADVVLAYRPKPKSKPAKKRQRRRRKAQRDSCI